jgi:DNA-directed RNA polymerase subunit RPC12/RpoP
MTRYVCIGCGFECSDDNITDELCPYCGEQMVKEKKVLMQVTEEIDVK